MNTVFVYGLLKPGQRLHHVAEPFVTRTSPARASGRLYDAGRAGSAGLPAARFDEDGEVRGHVLWLDASRLDEALRVLDDIEDEGTEYRRVVVEVATADGALRAFAYEYLLPLDAARAAGRSWREIE